MPREEAGLAVHMEIPKKIASPALVPSPGILEECVRVCACVCEHVRIQHASYVYTHTHEYMLHKIQWH